MRSSTIIKSHYSTFKSKNVDKTGAEVHKAFSMVYTKLTDEEKANYGEVGEKSGDPQREIPHGEGDFAG